MSSINKDKKQAAHLTISAADKVNRMPVCWPLTTENKILRAGKKTSSQPAVLRIIGKTASVTTSCI